MSDETQIQVQPKPKPQTATETFAAEVDGRLFFVRTGDKLSHDHPVVQAHPQRFNHQVD